ncbi:MAG TPA: hypothetical protein VJH92_04865 [Candidatus Nanoarchaeia archaeon]|nr:hypothetical protein [Candidatus Nanoarchaeia archaeon]
MDLERILTKPFRKLQYVERQIYERLYQRFYDLYEKDKEADGEISKKMVNLGRSVKYFAGTLAAATGTYLYKRLIDGNASPSELIFLGGITSAGIGLASHFYAQENISQAILKKNTKRDLTSEEKIRISRLGKIGKGSHFISAIALGVSFVDVAILNPKFLAILPILPFWYRFTIHKGYGAVYDSEVDYVLDERKKFPEKTSQIN